MASLNQIFYQAPGKLIQVNDATNEFIVSGYRLIVDKNLNRDLLIVETPSSTGDYGEKGNISFDDHHIYYCKAKNTWVRGKLASWLDNEPDQLITNIPNLNVTNPTNWWKMAPTSGQPLTDLGNYNFNSYGTITSFPYLYPATNTLASGYINPSTNLYYINYSTNLVDLAGLNQDFSISFETSRRPYTPYPSTMINSSNASSFILGNLFGGVGFHFRFADKNTLNSGNYLSGQNIVFGLNAHTSGFKTQYAFQDVEAIYWAAPGFGNGSGIPGKGNGNRWINVASTTSFLVGDTLKQVVVTNNASSKELKLYVNGQLEDTKSYVGIPITNVRKITQNQCVGMGIGGTPVGGVGNNPVLGTMSSSVASIAAKSLVTVKNLGFWKNIILDQEQITALYNAGNFKTYPFV